VPATGWDFNQISAGGKRQYFFEVPAGSRATEVSIVAVWNRQVRALAGDPMQMTATLADIDLRLYAASASGAPRLVDSSVSRVDNVEHIYLRSLSPGRYVIEVRSDMAADYCLTWDAWLKATMQAGRDDANKPTTAVPAHGTVVAGLN
jgi:hypothetical protein